MSPVKPALLLHACCGPCATSVVERLAPDFSLTLYYYNPCIEPADEWQRRLEALRALAGPLGLPVLAPPPGPEPAWEAVAAAGAGEPEGGARCRACWRLRLEATAARARRDGQAWFTTTLTVSRHKPSAGILGLGRALSDAGSRFLDQDFKKRNGFARSVELTRDHGLYRQDYCGCRYSLDESRARRAARAPEPAP